MSGAMETWFRLVHKVRGPGNIYNSFDVWARRTDEIFVLRSLGAKIGDRVYLGQGIRIQNATNGNCANLSIGDDVYVGTEVLFDLAAAIRIQQSATLAARVSIITHTNVGPGPLKSAYPPSTGAVVISEGAFIGFGSIVMQGVVVGASSVVAAGSVVTKSIADNSVAAGSPARVIRQVEISPS